MDELVMPDGSELLFDDGLDLIEFMCTDAATSKGLSIVAGGKLLVARGWR